MAYNYVCYNCCGLQKRSLYYEVACPNCGDLMTTKPWPVDEILQFNTRLKLLQGEYVDFTNVGSLRSNEPGLLSYAVNEDYLNIALSKPNVNVLFARDEDIDDTLSPITFIISEHPEWDFFLFHNYLVNGTDFYGTPDPQQITPDILRHPSTSIAATDVIIGVGSVMGPNVTIHGRTTIGAGVAITSGATIGLPGARIIRLDEFKFRALHGGGVCIGDNGFVGANSVIVKSVWRKPTTIEDNVFIGNLVNIGHNCHIREGAVILPGAILCGSVGIGRGATIGPGAVISNGVTIGDNAHVTLGAVVTKDVEPGERVSGNFAVPHDRLIQHVKDLAI